MAKDKRVIPDYPHPYKVIDGCLFIEVRTKNGSYEYEHLRNECIREVRQCHGELNFMDEQFYYTEPPQLPGDN